MSGETHYEAEHKELIQKALHMSCAIHPERITS